MQAIDQLTLEHETILKKLTLLIETFDSESHQALKTAKIFIDFVKNYVDKYHHDKEEKILFPWLLKKNPMLEQGPIRVMLMEHDQGRQIIKEMNDIVETNSSKPSANDLLKDLMEQYERLLINHIEKENNVLYQMAEAINADEGDGDAIMLPEFQKVEELRGKMAQDIVAL